MPVNRNALIRYRTIDNCLRNKYKKYTLEDLVESCSDALYEYEGIDRGVSKRTVQMDIQMMRSDKIGYNAPIIIEDKKYYRYEDPDYSITNIPLTDQDLGKLTEVVEILKQFKGFSHFQELSGMVQKLENKIYTARTNTEPVIDFEKNENLKGLEYIEPLYQAIIKKTPLVLEYQSFKAKNANTFDFHAYYLKEYRNRWFVIGLSKRKGEIQNLALDRIVSISDCPRNFIGKPKDFNPSEIYKNILGVTVNQNGKTEKILILADHQTAPYIQTKPIHHTQRIEETLPNGVIFSFDVQLNFELERELLGFGDRIRVLAPERLKQKIKVILTHALDQYQYDLTDNVLAGSIQKFNYKGFAVLQHVYSKKEINHIKSRVDQYFKLKNEKNVHALRNVLQEIPGLASTVLNSNLLHILKKINPRLFLTKAIFFDKTPDANWYVTWHQDITINVKNRVELDGYSGWTKKFDVHGVCPPEDILHDTITVRIHLDDADESNGALKVVAGSHHKKLSTDEISLISQNCTPIVCEVNACGIHIMKPLLLHASGKATTMKHRRVIHLEFNTIELPDGMEWAERLKVF
ncbi:MAG TPA: WYL domain-containing protein [Cyclobacteriaceae bacterium]|nr:WYL domain-containing protein [Cyclobacteriaceae bacterium]